MNQSHFWDLFIYRGNETELDFFCRSSILPYCTATVPGTTSTRTGEFTAAFCVNGRHDPSNGKIFTIEKDWYQCAYRHCGREDLFGGPPISTPPVVSFVVRCLLWNWRFSERDQINPRPLRHKYLADFYKRSFRLLMDSICILDNELSARVSTFLPSNRLVSFLSCSRKTKRAYRVTARYTRSLVLLFGAKLPTSGDEACTCYTCKWLVRHNKFVPAVRVYRQSSSSSSIGSSSTSFSSLDSSSTSSSESKSSSASS